jgi:Mn2+/Fe2+ NRAMP family transporter
MDHLHAAGPDLVSGASDTDPTTVATLVVVGTTTAYGLAWLTLLLLPVLGVVQTLATRWACSAGGICSRRSRRLRPPPGGHTAGVDRDGQRGHQTATGPANALTPGTGWRP